MTRPVMGSSAAGSSRETWKSTGKFIDGGRSSFYAWELTTLVKATKPKRLWFSFLEGRAVLMFVVDSNSKFPSKNRGPGIQEELACCFYQS